MDEWKPPCRAFHELEQFLTHRVIGRGVAAQVGFEGKIERRLITLLLQALIPSAVNPGST